MFDISFTELMLVGVIALIVIGPERLPKVARTLGHLVGRAQRYVTDVKTDIKREMDMDELSNIKGQMEDAAKSVKDSMKQASDTLRNPLDEAQKALKEASASVGNLIEDVKQETESSDMPPPEPAPIAVPAPEAAPASVPAEAANPKQLDNTTGTPT